MRLLLVTALVTALLAPAAALADRSSSERSRADAAGTTVVEKKGKRRAAARAAAAKLKAAKLSAARAAKAASSTDEREVKGAIDALSPSSITVGSLTCAIPTGVKLSSLFTIGAVAELKCVRVNGAWTFRRVHLEDDEADEREVKGVISAVSSGSITVSSLTCAIPAGITLSPRFTTGAFIELKCKLVGTVWTLDELERAGGDRTSADARDDDDDNDHDDDDDDDSDHDDDDDDE